MKTKEEVEELKRNWMNDPCWDIENTQGFTEWYEDLYAFRMEKEYEWKTKWKEELDSRPINLAKHLIETDYTGSLVYAVIAIAEELVKLNKSIEEFINRH